MHIEVILKIGLDIKSEIKIWSRKYVVSLTLFSMVAGILQLPSNQGVRGKLTFFQGSGRQQKQHDC